MRQKRRKSLCVFMAKKQWSVMGEKQKTVVSTESDEKKVFLYLLDNYFLKNHIIIRCNSPLFFISDYVSSRMVDYNNLTVQPQ